MNTDKNPTVLFRTDSSSRIGGGHVVRCLALADTFKKFGWKCFFACEKDSFKTTPILLESNVGIIEIGGSIDDDIELIVLNLGREINLVIFDHYDIDIDIESKFRECTNTIIVIDDLANRKHDADILIDQTFLRNKKDYQFLVPKKCSLMLGSEFVILRRDFHIERAQFINRLNNNDDSIKNIIILFGNNDSKFMSMVALDGVIDSGIKTELTIVLGKGVKNVDTIQRKIQKINNIRIKLLVNVRNIAYLISQSDMAIIAGGTTIWECLCIGVPALVIKTAKNQEKNINNLSKKGLIVYLGHYKKINKKVISNALSDLNENLDRIRNIGKTSRKICDGYGVRRIFFGILDCIYTKEKLPICFRLMEKKDGMTVFRWQCSPGMRKYFRNTSTPNIKEHNNWIDSKLNDANSLLLIITFDNSSVGLLNLCYKDNEIDVSILLDQKYQGLGIASLALELLKKISSGKDLLAEINPNNLASVKAFTSAGFIHYRGSWYKFPSKDVLLK